MPRMADDYFALSANDRAEILNGVAPLIGRRAEILEKDIWLCRVLAELFALPCAKPMAFKGGTSLSKVYRAIERFSEDIDVTIDYHSLTDDGRDIADLKSRNQRKRFSDILMTQLASHVRGALLPGLQSALSPLGVTFDLDESGEKLWAYYPSAVEAVTEYVRPSVLLEFGGRNSVDPSEAVEIAPDIASFVPAVVLPTAKVSVLSLKRTFWEKATLIHVECRRPTEKRSANRLSRHWYDLACLADHKLGYEAVADRGLLDDVVHLKQAFFYSSYAGYDRCNAGGLQLIPDDDSLGALQSDYAAMGSAGMFYTDPPEFGALIDRLRSLESLINQKASK